MANLRSFLSQWEKTYPSEFVRIKEEVDPRYEITAIVKKFDLAGQYPVILFENVRGYQHPVVCNVEATRKQLGLALGVSPEQVDVYYERKEDEVLTGKTSPPLEVEREKAAVKEVIIPEKEINLYHFPVITHHVGEQPYITRGIGFVRDPENGLLHAAYYRLMVKSPNHMVTHITPGRHLWYIYKKAEARRQPLPIAFVIGNHPAWSMGAQSRINHPPTEVDVIEALQGERLPLVRCETSDVLVPADAEIVIEGELRPGALESEGPWSDFTRYSQVAQRHSVFLKAITHRRDYIFQDSGSWLLAGHDYNRIPQQIHVRREIKRAVPSVIDFRFGFFPQPMYGLITLDKKHAGEPKQAILAAFAAELYLKYVFVFDSDINLGNINEVFWALATRVQADRDLLVLPGVLGTDLDISAPQEAVVTKVGIDATAKPFRDKLPPIGRIEEHILNKIDISRYVK